MKTANQQTQQNNEQQQQQNKPAPERTAPAGSPPRLVVTTAAERLADPHAARSDTLTRLDTLQSEMDAAPAWKRATRWWTDRERELEALSKGFVRINLLDPDGTLWRRLFLDETLWNALEALAAREGTSVDEQFNRGLAFGLGVRLDGGAK